jgi:hypothetical protein
MFDQLSRSTSGDFVTLPLLQRIAINAEYLQFVQETQFVTERLNVVVEKEELFEVRQHPDLFRQFSELVE